MAIYSVGQLVEWTWGRGIARAEVKEVFTQRITKTIKGSSVTRNATNDNPAHLLEQANGSLVLKSESELRAA